MLRPVDIKIRLLKKGISQAKIARSQDVVRSYVTHVIAGRNKNQRLRQAIADAIGMVVSDIWPNEKNNKRAA
ncbi:MAG: helix-turn-helix domain-containing protein [Nitrospirae bacterium]|nr:helix-turn-helix domain-containing protein [Nitrospirota bacterium]